MGRKPKNAPGPPRTRLEEIRRFRGIPLAQLAERVGIDKAQLYRIAAGEYGLSPRWRDKIARALSVRVEQLFAPIGEPVPFQALSREMTIEPRPYRPGYEPQAIGARVAAIVRYSGIAGPAELAALIGATAPDVVDWIEGRMVPPLMLMNRLAARAGVTLVWIYYGDDAGLLPGIAAKLKALLPPE